MVSDKMKVEIWSDIICPFCYIGKRKFEAALSNFGNSSQITIEWKAFQLSPDIKTDPSVNIHQFLARHKGLPLERAKSMNDQVSEKAKSVGLIYNFDKAIPANTFNAHRFSYYAKEKGVQGKAEEALFKSYFTDGKNVDDISTFISIAQEIGIDAHETKEVMSGDQYVREVESDIREAHTLGVRGVPFFVFNRRFAVSGAQSSEVFLSTLQKAFDEWLGERESSI
jgi:predicted DsbA family dithiol-disulfide isomerase